MSSDDIIVLVLAKPNAISDWRECLGPTDARRAKVTDSSSYIVIRAFFQEEVPESLRAKYGHDNTKNALHGSDSPVSAEREIKFMFSDSKCSLLYQNDK